MTRPNQNASANAPALAATGFIRQAQLIPTIIPVSHATLWRWVRNGQFCKPVKLGENVTAWRCEDVRDWLAAKANNTEAATK